MPEGAEDGHRGPGGDGAGPPQERPHAAAGGPPCAWWAWRTWRWSGPGQAGQAGGRSGGHPRLADPRALLEETARTSWSWPRPTLPRGGDLAAAGLGVHVLCEKPIAHTVGADRMIEGCRRAGVLLGIDFNQRTTPAYIRAHQLSAGGQLEDLYRVSFVASGWYRTQAYYDSGGWRGTWDGEGGGVAMNQAPHHLDLYCWLAGPPRRVKATALTRVPRDRRGEHRRRPPGAWRFPNAPPPPPRVDTFYTTTAEWPGRTEFLFAGERGRLLVAERQLRLYGLERSPGRSCCRPRTGASRPGPGRRSRCSRPLPGRRGTWGCCAVRPGGALGAPGGPSPAARTGATPWSWPTPCCWRLPRPQRGRLPIDRGALRGARAGRELSPAPRRQGSEERGARGGRAGAPASREQALATLPEGT